MHADTFRVTQKLVFSRHLEFVTLFRLRIGNNLFLSFRSNKILLNSFTTPQSVALKRFAKKKKNELKKCSIDQNHCLTVVQVDPHNIIR